MEIKQPFWKRTGAALAAMLILIVGIGLTGTRADAQTTPQQALEQLQLEDAAAVLIDGPDGFRREGHRALMLHDRLLDAAQPAQTGSTAYDALVAGAANSQGYALAMALLLEEVGLENALVQDPVTGEMWNRVKIDGVWYNLSAYRNDLSGDRTAFLKSDAAFAALLGSDPSRWTGEHPCTSIYYDDWFLNQSQDGGDLWKSEMYYTDGSGTLYAGYLMGTTSSSGIIREETGLSRVDACAVFDGSLYLIGSQDGGAQGLYLYNGSSGVEVGSGGTMVRRGSVTATGQDIGSQTIVAMYGTSTGLTLLAQDGSTRTVTLHTHTLGDWQTVQQMDCANVIPGKEVRICSDCEEIGEVRYEIPEHAYADWTVTQTPDPEQPGTVQRECTRCHDTITQSLPYGDLNLDEITDVLDVMTLAQSVVDGREPLPGLDGNYDQSTDGIVDVSDVMALAHYVVNR